MSLILTPALASVIPRFCDAGKGPSHDELTLLIQQVGLGDADPGQRDRRGPSEK